MESNNLPDSGSPINNDSFVTSHDFRLTSISLISSDGRAVDASTIVKEIQIRQDLYLGFMSGELFILDGIDIHNIVGFHGGEYIHMKITVPQEKTEINKSFRIYKISERKQLDVGQSYIIYFMSNEMFDSYTQKISKSYTNSKISDIVKDILKTNLKINDSKINIDGTSNPVSVVIPNWRCLESLNWLASRAYSSNYNTYFFYETFGGFYFKSLQAIYKSNPVNVTPYTFENKTGMKDFEMDRFSMDYMNSIKDFDILETINSGGFAMRLQTVDPLTRTFENNDLNNSSVGKLYDNSLFTDINLNKKYNSYYLNYLKIDGIEQWIKRNINLSNLNSSLIEIGVPGNTNLQVGSLININIPYSIVPVEGDMIDKRKSGKYLIVAVNHKFDLVNHTFTSLMMITRDSLPYPLPDTDSNLREKVSNIK